MIVDDHDMLRAGLRLFLAGFDDLEFAGEANSGSQAIDLCAQLQPDVVLMDMVMPDMDGATTTEIIRRQSPQVQVLALTSFQEEDLVQRALQAGAIGYLFKNVSAQELAQAIRDAYHGRSTLSQEATEMLIRATRQRAGQPQYRLTDREREVLALMAEGCSNAEIAQRLTITLSTVKFHVGNILRQLGVSSRTEAAALAWQHGLIDPPTPKP
jgi:NarL family two-component system response regulator LiaR